MNNMKYYYDITYVFCIILYRLRIKLFTNKYNSCAIVPRNVEYRTKK